jgi:hypothetical protein
MGMLEYYADIWLTSRPHLETYIFNNKPQVEVHSLVPIPVTPNQPDGSFYGYDEVYYASTIDRVVIIDGELWIIDYKTAKRIFTLHYQTDPQIHAYRWVASSLYDKPVAGFIYQQHLKRIPDEPKFVGTRGQLSTAQNQATTHQHYRKALQKLYGKTLDDAPAENISFLNYLATQEDSLQDKFVRRDIIRGNRRQLETTGTLILTELEDILNPDISLYPNPTRDCAHMCPFNGPCVSMDDGSDYDHELSLLFAKKEHDFDSWRQYLPQRPKEI